MRTLLCSCVSPAAWKSSFFHVQDVRMRSLYPNCLLAFSCATKGEEEVHFVHPANEKTLQSFPVTNIEQFGFHDDKMSTWLDLENDDGRVSHVTMTCSRHWQDDILAALKYQIEEASGKKLRQKEISSAGPRSVCYYRDIPPYDHINPDKLPPERNDSEDADSTSTAASETETRVIGDANISPIEHPELENQDPIKLISCHFVNPGCRDFVQAGKTGSSSEHGSQDNESAWEESHRLSLLQHYDSLQPPGTSIDTGALTEPNPEQTTTNGQRPLMNRAGALDADHVPSGENGLEQAEQAQVPVLPEGGEALEETIAVADNYGDQLLRNDDTLEPSTGKSFICRKLL